jgi:hypothetical protein
MSSSTRPAIFIWERSKPSRGLGCPLVSYQLIAKATYLPKGHLRFHFVPVQRLVAVDGNDDALWSAG